MIVQGLTVMESGTKKEKALKLCMVMTGLTGVFLRAFYVYYTPSWLRQHDVIGFGADEGQAAFIEYFYNGHFLLDFDPRQRWGFFQPPLHHMLSAAWIHLQESLGAAYSAACENVQLLTLIYGFITLLFAFMMLRYFMPGGLSLLIAFALCAVHPGFIQMSGSINNDMLAIMFSMMTIYFGLKWYDEPSWRYTILLALTIGLGMMAKLSAALVAPAIAFLFITKWIRSGKEGFVSYLLKYIVFIVICAPLGLWSPVRNLLRFGVPVSFTPEVGEPVTATIWQRIFDIRTGKPFVYMEKYGDPYNEFNIFLGIMKSSLFGDQDIALALSEAGHGGVGATVMSVAGWILLLSGSVLAVLALYATLRVLIGDRYIGNGVFRAYFSILYVLSMVVYVKFMLSSGSYSSMDFRYVLYLLPVEALMLGLYTQGCCSAFRRFAVGVTAVFVLSTTAVYTMLSIV